MYLKNDQPARVRKIIYNPFAADFAAKINTAFKTFFCLEMEVPVTELLK